MSEEKNSLPTTQQLMGVENINTTRLLSLKSWQANINNSATDKIWTFPQVFRRKYLQHQVSLQTFRIWNVFPSVPRQLQITPIVNNVPTPITICAGNWNQNALANYLTHKMQVLDPVTNLPDPILSTVVTWDPYQLKYYFCPSGITLLPSEANKLLGFPEDGVSAESMSFYPALLVGPTCINLYTNFTINNIPVSHNLACIPLNGSYGSYVFVTNYDNSQSSLILDHDINIVRLILQDDDGNELSYPENLKWECQLAIQAIPPEGFSPLEA